MKNIVDNANTIYDKIYSYKIMSARNDFQLPHTKYMHIKWSKSGTILCNVKSLSNTTVIYIYIYMYQRCIGRDQYGYVLYTKNIHNLLCRSTPSYWIVVGNRISPCADIEVYMMTSSNGNIFRVTGPLCGEFTAQKSVTRSFDVFFDLRLNKPLSKHSWGWWFETLSRPLWRHCNNNEYIPCYHRQPTT